MCCVKIENEAILSFKTKSHRDQTNVQRNHSEKNKNQKEFSQQKEHDEDREQEKPKREQNENEEIKEEAKKKNAHTHIKLFKEPNIVTPNKSYLNGWTRS